ncbi:MAG TPA: hypothetical protein VFS62_11895, partial [Chloroflexota bacterium]|nr:hypothetical protein [Chloroflexota bacterium]
KFVQQSLGFGQGVPADLAKDAKAMAAKDGSAKKQRTRGARKARDGQAELLKPDGAADEPAPEVRAEDEEHER